MKTRAPGYLAIVPPALLLAGCLATTPSDRQEPAASAAPASLLPSSSAAVISEDARAPAPQPAPERAEAAITPAEPAAPVVEPTPAPAVETTQPAELPGAGRIMRVNTRLHYVLLEVSGRLHAGQDVVVFRDGQPVGRLRMSTPRQGRYASADILDGDVREGDLVK